MINPKEGRKALVEVGEQEAKFRAAGFISVEEAQKAPAQKTAEPNDGAQKTTTQPTPKTEDKKAETTSAPKPEDKKAEEKK